MSLISNKTKQAFWLVYLCSCFLWQGLSIANEQFVQFGFEYDSNVYKNFGAKKDDFVLRGHYMSRIQVFNKENLRGQFHYQQGVKKFIQENNQDQLIQSFSLSTQYEKNNFTFEWRPSLKVLIERKSELSSSYDIEENYVLPALHMRAMYQHNNTRYIFEPGARLFQFYANDDFSNVSEWVRFAVEHRLNQYFQLGANYIFSLEQFLDVNRRDSNHDIGFFIEYPFKPNLKLSYTFADSRSSVDRFSFVKHQMMFRLFYDLGERPSGIPYVSIYVSGIVQWNKFPSVFDFDDEGQRFLLTESEGQTFNSYAGKVSYHMSPKQHLELKYTSFSNDLSSQQLNYDRSIYYIGFKQRF